MPVLPRAREESKKIDSLIEEGFVVEGEYHGFAHANIRNNPAKKELCEKPDE